MSFVLIRYAWCIKRRCPVDSVLYNTCKALAKRTSRPAKYRLRRHGRGRSPASMPGSDREAGTRVCWRASTPPAVPPAALGHRRLLLVTVVVGPVGTRWQAQGQYGLSRAEQRHQDHHYSQAHRENCAVRALPDSLSPMVLMMDPPPPPQRPEHLLPTKK